MSAVKRYDFVANVVSAITGSVYAKDYDDACFKISTKDWEGTEEQNIEEVVDYSIEHIEFLEDDIKMQRKLFYEL